MRLDTRPLLDTAADADVFVDRADEVERLERALQTDVNTVVFGDRGIGKSSFLRHVAYRLRDQGEPVVIVDAGLASSLGQLLTTIQDAIGNAPHLGDLFRASMERAVRPVGASARDAIEAVRRLDVGGRLVLVLDNLPSPDIGYDLFGKLRDEVWRLPHTWAVSASDADQMQLLAPPADAFFGMRLTLGPLDAAAATQLLVRRGCNLALADLLGGSGEGNPRALLGIARQIVVDGADPEEILKRRAETERAVARLGRPASMLWHELVSLGSAAASDDALLDRLGWTRARATQVLRELEDEGFVLVHDERSERGRPRRVYVPVIAHRKAPVWE